MRRTDLSRWFFPAGLVIFACAVSAPAAGPGDQDWTIGSWEGTRRDAGSGQEDPMTMKVEAILAGHGQIRQLEVGLGDGLYRGFSVQVFDAEHGRWVRQYVNEARGWFSRYEGVVTGDRCVWRSTTPGRKRESRLVSERPAPDRWVRTMSVSEDGGKTWRDLWIDRLHRKSVFR